MDQEAFQNMRIVGVEDGSFQKGITRNALLVAVSLTGSKIERVKACKITVDGLDATQGLCGLLIDWKFDAILLAGVSFAGFNVIDPEELFENFSKPVIVISRTRPRNRAVKSALQKHFEDWQVRWKIFEKLGRVHKIVVSPWKSPVYMETVRGNVGWASNLVRALVVYSRVPEPLRVARLIARGLS